METKYSDGGEILNGGAEKVKVSRDVGNDVVNVMESSGVWKLANGKDQSAGLERCESGNSESTLGNFSELVSGERVAELRRCHHSLSPCSSVRDLSEAEVLEVLEEELADVKKLRSERTESNTENSDTVESETIRVFMNWETIDQIMSNITPGVNFHRISPMEKASNAEQTQIVDVSAPSETNKSFLANVGKRKSFCDEYSCEELAGGSTGFKRQNQV
uniref:Uncharacterized protein n=1 Tax=Timspurckia oligopyrenoides TaxID=708627 RepID=A0A7S0ZAN2_9RHOD|mmetsp:Transcript_10327/g.18607  ORF Transcript_10327/g.18607 Transcript_10327/m.18607 type:complete len:218 (+) Transcript_10327:198-851(+)